MKLQVGARSYNLQGDSVAYAVKKAFRPLLRGAIWQLLRGRSPNGLMVGRGVRVLDSTSLAVGRGVSIGAYSYLDCSAEEGVRIQDAVTIRECAWIQCRSGLNERGESLVIGEGSYIGPFAVIGVGGPISIGRNVQAGARLSLSAESHQLGHTGSYVDGVTSRSGIVVGDSVWIGNSVTVLDGVKIGDRAVVGAGAIVTRDVPPEAVVAGNPARQLSQRQEVAE